MFVYSSTTLRLTLVTRTFEHDIGIPSPPVNSTINNTSTCACLHHTSTPHRHASPTSKKMNIASNSRAPRSFAPQQTSSQIQLHSFSPIPSPCASRQPEQLILNHIDKVASQYGYQRAAWRSLQPDKPAPANIESGGKLHSVRRS